MRTTTTWHPRLSWSIILATALLLCTLPAMAQDVGGNPDGVALTPVNYGSILPEITETGPLTLSIDGVGTSSETGVIDVEKPAGATVRGAYMAAASTGFSSRTLADGDISIDGNPVSWDIVTNSNISSFNHWADVTSIVAPIVDAAPAGTVSLTISEVNSSGIDGSILAVIFDDPGQTTDNTIVLLFGAQAVNGDNFSISLADPVDKSDPDFVLDMSLGISFGCQTIGPCGSGGQQFSHVEVNGTRITSSAGGTDDGELANGALMTVGGVGDSNDNPADPLADPGGDPRYDDELYNLIPFVDDGDTQINVFTENPSNDDNIFFAAFVLGSSVAIVGEGIVLGPTNSTNPVGTTHTVTATVQDDAGDPVAGRQVDFEILSGPNAGLTASANTDGDGKATFSWSSTVAGTDVVVARFVDSEGQTQTSNEATKTWEEDTIVDTTDPVCRMQAINPGPPTTLEVFVQDSESGLASILVHTNDNATVSIPPFDAGSTASLIVTATKIDQNQRSSVVIEVSDVAGNSVTCDPIITTLSAEMPEAFTLEQNYPNPFNPATTIRFQLAEPTAVVLEVFDVAGRRVATLVDEALSAGTYGVEWDGRDDAGRAVAGGLYLYRIRAGHLTETKAMMLMK